MCTTAFHSGIVCHVPDSFPEIFRRKTSRKLKKKKKKKKTIFQRSWKAEKCKTKKTSRKPKKQKKQYSRSLGEGGGQTRVSKYCFFLFFLVFWFSRGFFWFCTFLLSKTSGLFFFFFFVFLVFSRFLYFFQGALPKDSQNVILDLFK